MHEHIFGLKETPNNRPTQAKKKNVKDGFMSPKKKIGQN